MHGLLVSAGTAPVLLLLVIRRLKWLQVMVRSPEAHCQLTGTMFGHFDFERVGTLDASGCLTSCANPWAVQVLNDLGMLKWLDDAEGYPQSYTTNCESPFTPSVSPRTKKCTNY